MRLVIDMQGAQSTSRFRGIGRYSMAFAQALVRQRGAHDVVLALNGLFPESIEPIRAAFDGLMAQENIQVWHAPGPVHFLQPNNQLRREVAERIRESFLASLQPDIVHVTSLFEGWGDESVTSVGVLDNGTPVSVSLYDLIPLLNPAEYLDHDAGYARYYRYKFAQLGNASLLLAISDSSRAEALAHLPLRPDRVVDVTAAADPSFKPGALGMSWHQLPQRWRVRKPFVLYTGGADARKNLARLAKAFASLAPAVREAHQLVFAGKIDGVELQRLQAAVRDAQLRDEEVVYTGFVSHEELLQLYQTCRLFVFPSFHEGFGLPALEAMACGAATIGANTSSVPEVIGREDALFDPYDTRAICAAMARVLSDDAVHDALVAHGLERASSFSWDRCAQLAWAAFEQFHKEQPRNAALAKTADWPNILVQQLSDLLQGKDCADDELAAIAQAAACVYGPDGPRSPPCLFVDVSILVREDARTGIQRVTRSILRSLLAGGAGDYKVVPVYATDAGPGYRQVSFVDDGAGDLAMRVGEEDLFIDYQARDIFLGLDLAQALVVYQASVLDHMRRNGVRVYFTVYDLLPIQMPHAFPPTVDDWHKTWLQIVARMDGALCISKAVAEELTQWLEKFAPPRLRPFQVSWFHLGADIQSSQPSRGMPKDAEQVLSRLRAGKSFLCVGTIEPRKGIAHLLDAMDVLWQRGTDANLVLVGKAGWRVEPLLDRIRAHPELGKRLFWLAGISDEYLEAVYGASTALVAASEGEGFGLPLIEAAQHGLSLIARDIPVFHEVAGGHAYFFQDASPQGLAASLQTWLDLFARDEHPRSSGMPWLTWEQSAGQLLNAILMRPTQIGGDKSRALLSEDAYALLQPPLPQEAGLQKSP